MARAGGTTDRPRFFRFSIADLWQTATAATVGVGVLEAVRESVDPARDALLSIAPYLDGVKWLLLVVTLIGIGVMIWARIDDRRKGLR